MSGEGGGGCIVRRKVGRRGWEERNDVVVEVRKDEVKGSYVGIEWEV